MGLTLVQWYLMMLTACEMTTSLYYSVLILHTLIVGVQTQTCMTPLFTAVSLKFRNAFGCDNDYIQ